MPDRPTMSLQRLGWWCLVIALLWYFLGWVWAVGLGLFGLIFEFLAYFFWVGDLLEERERRLVDSIPPDELARIEGQSLVVSIFPDVTKSISLQGIVEARLGEEMPDYVGLILTDAAGVSGQHYIQTNHPNRNAILSLVQDYVQNRGGDT